MWYPSTTLLTSILVHLFHLIGQLSCHENSYRGAASSTGKDSHHVHQMNQQERPTSFHDPKVVQDQEHVKEHLEGVADMGDKDMSQEELEFHYFKLHDFDNNTMLDGLEIYKALTHLLPYDSIQDSEVTKVNMQGKTEAQVAAEKLNAEQKYYTEIVDQVLREDDLDNDGYLTYLEYVLARRREEMRSKRESEKSQL